MNLTLSNLMYSSSPRREYAVEGDIVLVPGTAKGKREFYESYDKSKAKKGEDGDDKIIMEDFVDVGDDEDDVSAAHLDGVFKTVTMEEEKAKKYALTDVVMPLVGYEVAPPTNKVGELIADLLEKDGYVCTKKIIKMKVSTVTTSTITNLVFLRHLIESF